MPVAVNRPDGEILRDTVFPHTPKLRREWRPYPSKQLLDGATLALSPVHIDSLLKVNLDVGSALAVCVKIAPDFAINVSSPRKILKQSLFGCLLLLGGQRWPVFN